MNMVIYLELRHVSLAQLQIIYPGTVQPDIFYAPAAAVPLDSGMKLGDAGLIELGIHTGESAEGEMRSQGQKHFRRDIEQINHSVGWGLTACGNGMRPSRLSDSLQKT